MARRIFFYRWGLYSFGCNLIKKEEGLIRMGKIYRYEKKIFSQHGEDGITQYFVSMLPIKKYFVEFGVGSGTECNCRILKEMGWEGLMMDYLGENEVIKKEFITAENIVQVFEKHNVSSIGGVLSIDIDGNDFWVWKALPEKYKFDLVIIEYNASLGWKDSFVMPYQSDFRWDGSDYFGGSIRAFEMLGRQKGYILVYAEHAGVNLFFLSSRHANLLVGRRTLKDIYSPPLYGLRSMGHPRDLLNRKYTKY